MTVVLRVEGGFTGLSRSVVLEDDGACRVERGGVVVDLQVGAATAAAVAAELDRSGLFDVDREFPPPDGADRQRYQLEHRGVTVVAYDTTVPAELIGAVEVLEALTQVEAQP